MLYKVKLYNNDTGKIYVPPQFFLKQTGTYVNKVILRAGLLYKEVTVISGNGLHENEFVLTSDVLDALSLPLNISYQIRVEKDEISIGPVIGILLAKSGTFFTEKRLIKLLEYTLKYEEIHGLLCVFCTDGINFNKNTVEGYYFVPGTTLKSPGWEKGIFPLPASIFRRVGLSNGTLAKLKQCTGNRLFNSYYFNKWEFWCMASKNEFIKSNVPFTRMYKTFDDVEEMLALYDSLYLKPVNGSLGNGLVKVTKTKEGWSFQSKYDHGPVNFISREQAADFAGTITGNRSYLVQQDIHLLKYKDQYVDFRVNMQKDNTMMWNCTGIITCTGASGGIHSNYSNEGEYMLFEDFLMKCLAVSEAETSRKKQDIIELCKKVCRMLDESGENYGDLGMDIGFDISLTPWIFEVNKTQFQHLPLMINDYQTYYTARANPVRYAAALCGFMKLL